MGPRPFGRGMVWWVSWILSGYVLQWGRDLSVAEWWHYEHADSATYMLQWGRDLSVAE